MNERLKKIRKALDLTQQEFANRIGVKRNTVATYEMGRSSPSDSAVSLICREFNVNENWLRNGGSDDDMFVKISDISLDEFAKLNNATESDYQLIRNYLSLTPNTRVQIQSLFSFKE